MNNDSERRILAIDYGSKRIGIAISDPMLLFPSITLTLKNSSQTLDELIKIVNDKNVIEIVLGVPDLNNKTCAILIKEIMAFKTKLEESIKISIQLWDEQFTSKIASERIRDSITKKSKRRNKEIIDSQSAAVILEEYLMSINKRVK